MHAISFPCFYLRTGPAHTGNAPGCRHRARQVGQVAVPPPSRQAGPVSRPESRPPGQPGGLSRICGVERSFTCRRRHPGASAPSAPSAPSAALPGQPFRPHRRAACRHCPAAAQRRFPPPPRPRACTVAVPLAPRLAREGCRCHDGGVRNGRRSARSHSHSHQRCPRDCVPCTRDGRRVHRKGRGPYHAGTCAGAGGEGVKARIWRRHGYARQGNARDVPRAAGPDRTFHRRRLCRQRQAPRRPGPCMAAR